MSDLLATKPLDLLLTEAHDESGTGLRRVLGPVNLVTLGIGAIIGAGIFVLTGTVAATFTGPAVVLSFILAGSGCIFAGLCYAEFASLIPIAGSAYTYGYATLGEIFAWIIGWDLIIEYAFGAASWPSDGAAIWSRCFRASEFNSRPKSRLLRARCWFCTTDNGRAWRRSGQRSPAQGLTPQSCPRLTAFSIFPLIS